MARTGRGRYGRYGRSMSFGSFGCWRLTALISCRDDSERVFSH